MPNLPTALYPGSFNGVSFFCDSDTVETGKKTVTHYYPDKDFSYTEELGGKTRQFSLRGFIYGNDWELQRDALINALKTKGIGVLMHPFYGFVFAVCTNFSITHDMGELTIVRFEMNFEESNNGDFPEILGDTASAILGDCTSALANLNSVFTTAYQVKNLVNINNYANYGEALANKFTSGINNNSGINKATFLSSLTTFSTNIYGIVVDGANTSSSISGLFTQFNNTQQEDANKQAFKMMSDIYDWEDIKYNKYADTIAGEIEQDANQHHLKSLANANVILNLYRNFTLIDFLDTDELDIYYEDVESKYSDFLSKNTLDISFSGIRTKIGGYAQNLKVNLSKVVNVNIPIATSFTKLLYDYYENFELENEIISINSFLNCSKVLGDIKIFGVQQ